MEEDAHPRSKKRPLRPQDTTKGDQAPDAKRPAKRSSQDDVKKTSVPVKGAKTVPQKQGKSTTKTSKKKSGDGDQKKRSADQHNFPEKLMQLINDNVDPDHVSWIDSEEAVSFKTDGFQEHVLDKFFQGLKYDSFVRKLNRWGFRRVTSEGVPAGHVAYYHNSFRKEEQELLSTMGIGKKNDPEVRDLQAFGGEQSMIGSASAAIAASASGTGRSGARTSAPEAPTHLNFLSAAIVAPQPSGGDHQLGSLATSTVGALPASVRQESKTEALGSTLAGPRMDVQQQLLEAMLARQRQTDVVALQEREAQMLAERILIQRSQQQQRASAAITSALTGSRDDELGLRLAALAAQSTALGQPQQPRSFLSQLPQANLSERDPRLSSDPTIELLLRQRLQSTNPAANLGLVAGGNMQPNLNALGNVAANVNMQGNLNQNIQGNLNQIANAAAGNANTQGNSNLENLWRFILQNRQSDTQGQNPGAGQGQGPQR